MTIKAFPLAWPSGRPRADFREGGRFRVSLSQAVKDVRFEVDLLGGTQLVISSNAQLQHGNSDSVRDVGVAVYFMHKKRRVCFACDRWESVASNLRAIGKTIGALRGIERWGTGEMVEQAFTGFVALPAPEQPWEVLGVPPDAAPEEVRKAYRQLANDHHPDRGGDEQRMMRINAARDALLKHLGGG